jgi:hypothetical protein
VTFEAQRDREQLLIDRGEQYSRAVNLYVRKFNKYPPDFDALDNTQNIRFLRRRYVDPMTGKDEWRIIHVGPGGVFTDSLVYNKATANNMAAADTFSTVLTQMQQAGGAPVDPSQTGGGDVGERRRSSESGSGGGTGPTDPNNPNNIVPPLLGIGGTSSAPLLAVPGSSTPGLPGQTGANQLPPGAQMPPGAQIPPGASQSTSQQPAGAPTQGGAAANLINQLLTSPRPGGFPGAPQNGQQPSVDQFGNPIQPTGANGVTPGTTGTTAGTPAGSPTGGQVVGGGMAGVASKHAVQGIKIYNDRKKYNEWEFVYDASKDPARVGAGAAPVNNVPPANGAAGATGATSPGATTGSSIFPTTPTTAPGGFNPSPVPPPPPSQ